jgi:hypothetical protein
VVKSKLIESIRQLILKQQPTQDSLKAVHPAVIEAEISKAYNSIMKQFYDNDIRLMDAELDFFAKKYPVTLIDESYTDYNMLGEAFIVYTGKKYMTLPARPVELKRNLGIRYVKPQYGNVNFVRTSETELDTIRGLEIYCCSGNIFYYMDGNKIIFDFPIDDLKNVDRVFVKLLPLFEEFEDSDNIEVPGGEDSLSKMILQLMGYRLTDNTNDDAR